MKAKTHAKKIDFSFKPLVTFWFSFFILFALLWTGEALVSSGKLY